MPCFFFLGMSFLNVTIFPRQSLQQKRVRMDEMAYCTVLSAWDRAGNWQQAIRQLEEMTSYSTLVPVLVQVQVVSMISLGNAYTIFWLEGNPYAACWEREEF